MSLLGRKVPDELWSFSPSPCRGGRILEGSVRDVVGKLGVVIVIALHLWRSHACVPA